MDLFESSGDFDESLLEERFSVMEFTNRLIRFINAGVVSDNEKSLSNVKVLDLNTPIKKLNYDINEIDSKIDSFLKSKSVSLINQYVKKQQFDTLMKNELTPSLDYLNISYNRLNDDILQPYEKIRKLQSVLNKIHQTSNLLRDSLIFIHLINKIKKTPIIISNCQELSILHSQISIILNGNINLITLRLIKQFNSTTVQTNKKSLLNFISLKLTNECLKMETELDDFKKNSTIAILSQSLFILSPIDFTTTYTKIIQSIVSSTVQPLSKTINSIKNLPIVFRDKVIKNALTIYNLEYLLKEIKPENTNNTNLLAEFISLQGKKPNTSQIMNSKRANRNFSELYWSSVSNTYKKDFDISINRGGPVGKSLINNKQFILDTINDAMKIPHKVNGNTVTFDSQIDTILASVSILSK